MPTANYVLLERIELNASATSVAFTNIPQSGYTDLKVVVSARSNRADTDDIILMKPNNSSSNLTYRALTANGSTASSGTLNRFYVDGNTFTANTFANVEIYIPNFTSNSYKSWSLDSVTENNGTTAYSALMAGLWSDTTAISSLVFAPIYGTAFTANSTFSLYGLAAVGTTPVIAPKASGGNITTDGTYWYHTFLASGTFTPQLALNADCLVIAGGGGGGATYSGGGGAGGISYLAASSFTTTSYSITIGAGGAGQTGPSYGRGVNGSNSTFNGITSNGGGGGGYWQSGTGYTGANGGSGGGGAMGNTSGTTTAGGSATQGSTGGATGYGNAGGSGRYTSSSPFKVAGGGGGGAGAAGGSGTTTAAGAGGAGLNTWASWASATSTGVSGYYAGGGGGYAENETQGLGGAGGGGNGLVYQSPASTAGTVNTGSGGGAGSVVTDPAGIDGKSGGSGIVIVRYTVA